MSSESLFVRAAKKKKRANVCLEENCFGAVCGAHEKSEKSTQTITLSKIALESILL